jgi:ParB family chromosome partitioning protein
MCAKQIKQRGLGRGFDVLLPKNFDDSLLLDASERIRKIKLDSIIPNAAQPRSHFNPKDTEELAASIKRHGVLQPIIVTPQEEGTGKYKIVAGERRWRAAKQAGLSEIPTIVRSLKDLERLEIALVENVQRVDLSPLEQADAIEMLHRQLSVSYENIATRLGKASSTVVNTARLVHLPEDAKQALRNEQITEGHARQILSVKDYSGKQSELLNLIIKNGWSVRQAERFVAALKDSAPDTKSEVVSRKIRSETPETKLLGKRLKAPVAIRFMAHGGKLEISFKSATELERLLRDLNKGLS